MTLLLVNENREYLLAPGDTLETDLGVLEVPEDAQPGDTVETHLGEPFETRGLRGPDLFHHFERTGAPMMPRDVGLVVGHTGVGRGDSVLVDGRRLGEFVKVGSGCLIVAVVGEAIDTHGIENEKEDVGPICHVRRKVGGFDKVLVTSTEEPPVQR